MLCPCNVRHKFVIHFWNRTILLCMPCIYVCTERSGRMLPISDVQGSDPQHDSGCLDCDWGICHFLYTNSLDCSQPPSNTSLALWHHLNILCYWYRRYTNLRSAIKLMETHCCQARSKTEKSDSCVSVYPSVCLSVRLFEKNNWTPTGRILMKFEAFSTICREN
jgi:hypothetical protein